VLSTTGPNRYTIYCTLISSNMNNSRQISFCSQKYLHRDFVVIQQFLAK
jgi:hypothetical protein